MEIPVSIVLSPEALASLRGSTGPTLFDKSESINNLTDNPEFIREVASRIHPKEIAEHLDTDDLAEEMTRKVELDAGEIAGYIDVESVAGYIDTEEIASRMDMDDVVDAMPMGRLANALAKQIVENPALREALVEAFINRLTHSLLPKSST